MRPNGHGPEQRFDLDFNRDRVLAAAATFSRPTGPTYEQRLDGEKRPMGRRSCFPGPGK